MATILVVDDDKHILDLVTIQLEKKAYKVLQANDGAHALNVLRKESCDLAVVDVMMPFMNGYELTENIRTKYDIPVILLTAKGQIDDKEKGFQSGTDDYLVKPFEPKELQFRIDALLRRYGKEDLNEIRIGDVLIKQATYEVDIGQKTMMLPLKEFELLYFLAKNHKQTFSREDLIEQVWGIDFAGDNRTVDVHIKRLRGRFKDVTDDIYIKTVRGIGYMLA